MAPRILQLGSPDSPFGIPDTPNVLVNTMASQQQYLPGSWAFQYTSPSIDSDIDFAILSPLDNPFQSSLRMGYAHCTWAALPPSLHAWGFNPPSR